MADKPGDPVQAIQIRISYDPFTMKLYSELDTHLASLRNVLSPLNNKTYTQTGSQSVTGGFLGLSLPEGGGAEENVRRQEILKTFVSMVRSFINFMDALVGIKTVVGEQTKLPKSIKTIKQLQEYMDISLKENIHKVAINKSLTNTKKLDMLPRLSSDYDLALRGYFDIRNAIEHHKSVASRDMAFSRQHQELFTDKGVQLTNLPMILEGPSTISVKFDWITNVFKKGSEITLSESDLEDFIMTLRLRIIPELITKLIKSG